MVTVAQKTGSVSTLIDDIASTLSAAGWTDSDADVTNDGSDGQWLNNGRVFQHPNTGNHLLFYIQDTGNRPAGVRCLISEDWDATNTRPSGRSNNRGEDPDMSDAKGLGDSFPNYANYSSDARLGIWTQDGNQTGVARDDATEYFISASAEHLTVSAVDRSDPDWGGNGWMLFEEKNDKFWADGWGNWCAFGKQGSYGNAEYCADLYGWTTYNSGSDNNTGIRNGGGFRDGHWGLINPDATDDTFVFRRCILFNDDNNKVPSGYVNDIAHNHQNQGLNHGETITVDGTTFKCHRAKGEGIVNRGYNDRDWNTILLRFE